MPCPAIRIGFGVGRLCQRSVHAAAFVSLGEPVRNRANQRVRERDTDAEAHKTGSFHRLRGRRCDLKQARRPPEQDRVTGGLGSSDEQQLTRVGRQLGDAPPESSPPSDP